MLRFVRGQMNSVDAREMSVNSAVLSVFGIPSFCRP